MKAVLVTGSRDWSDQKKVSKALDKIDPAIVIHGACPTGADFHALQWWLNEDRGASMISMPAQWQKYSPSRIAGPKRNLEMLKVLCSLRECGYQCFVIAFPKGKSFGTRGMMRLAKVKDFKVIDLGL